MSFTLFSKTGSDLTYVRESENFSRMMRKGVFEGMQVYRGSSGFDVSINAGYFSINGRLVRETTTQTDVLTVPTPVGDEHNLIWVDLSDPATPSYKIKTGGSYTAPITLSPSESATGLVLADVWAPFGAIDITDCVIANRDLIKINAEPSNLWWNANTLRVAKGSGSYRSIITWDDLKIVGITPNSESRKAICSFVTAAGSPLTTDVNGQRYAIVFVRSKTSWSDPYEALVVEVAYADDDPETGADAYNAELVGNDDGGFSASSSKDEFPYRPNLDGAVIIAIHDRNEDTVVYCGVGAAPGGFGLVDGQMENTIASIESTAYGTSESGNVIDIDDLITNITTLKDATLNDAYSSMGGATGSGRVIEVDRLPVEFRHSQYDGQYDMYDQWSAAQKTWMDSNEDGVVNRAPKALDVFTKNTAKGERFLHARRPAVVDSNSCILGNATLINGGSRIEISSLGSITTSSVFNQYAEQGSYKVYSDLLVEIQEDLSGRAVGNVFRLAVDFANDVFYLVSEDTLATVTPGTLTSITYPKTCTGTVTVWDVHANMGFEGSSLQNVMVTGQLSGPGSRPAKASFVQSSAVSRSLASDVMGHEDSSIIKASFARGYVSTIVSSGAFGGYTGNRRMYSDGMILLTASVSSGNPIEVKVWKSSGELIGTITTLGNATSNDVGYVSCTKDIQSTYVAVPVGRVVEYYAVDTINSYISYLGSTNYGDGATDEARVCIPATKDRFWIGGSYSVSTSAHNLELQSLISGSVVQRYRVGKTSLASVYGHGLKSNGQNMVALAIHSMVPNTSIVDCVNLNSDGTIPSPGVGSYEWVGSSFYKSDWNNDLTNPLMVAITSEDILVYGTDGGNQIVVDRYPVYTSTARLDTTPTAIDFVPTKSIDIDVDTGLTINALVFDANDDGELVMIGRDAQSSPTTQEYSVAYVMDPKTLEVKWRGLYSAVTYDKMNVVGAACCDGVSMYFLDDPTSSGSASIKRMDTINGQRIAHRPSRNSTIKRNLIYGK